MSVPLGCRLALALILGVSVGLLSTAAPAHAAVAYEHNHAIWITADDGSAPKRIATGFEPHLVPGGSSVLYRNRSGTKLYRAPTTGGRRRHVLTIRVPRKLRAWLPVFRLGIDFSDDGRRALVLPLDHKPVIADLATGRTRDLPLRVLDPRLSPDGREVAWVRGRERLRTPARRCDVAILALASRRVRSLARVPCSSSLSWDAPGLALASEDRRGTHISVIDPTTGASRPLLSAPRVLGVAGASPSGAWQIVALADNRHAIAAWLLRPDGRLLKRPLPRTTLVGASEDFVFTPDDQAVIVQESDGTLVRTALADGARQPLPVGTDGPFDTL